MLLSLTRRPSLVLVGLTVVVGAACDGPASLGRPAASFGGEPRGAGPTADASAPMTSGAPTRPPPSAASAPEDSARRPDLKVGPPAASVAVPGGSASADPGVVRPETPWEIPPLPQDSMVLHVGDSMAGALGVALRTELRRRGVRAVVQFRTSSFITDWGSEWKLSGYVAQYQPDLVLISLGANETKVEKPSSRIKAIRRLVRQTRGRPCVWVAPPLWKEGQGDALLDVIRDNVSPCLYLDTPGQVRHMPRTKDGVHPGWLARPVWARYVLRWILAQRVPTAEQPWKLRDEAVAVPVLDFGPGPSHTTR